MERVADFKYVGRKLSRPSTLENSLEERVKEDRKIAEGLKAVTGKRNTRVRMEVRKNPV